MAVSNDLTIIGIITIRLTLITRLGRNQNQELLLSGFNSIKLSYLQQNKYV